MMGKMSRTKGRSFEQRIARIFRARWSLVEVRRSSQAERAFESDVFCTGHPTLERLWLELQDAREPTPHAKLAQAERDCASLCERELGMGIDRYPVVVWHKLRERTVHVTMRAWVFDELRNSPSSDNAVITMDLPTFLDVVGRDAA